jgi:4-amino-4-deoxy-L-arabinose transferase-like glycosyltransferase
MIAMGLFALELGDDPFVDEYAYITQSYQPDLVLAGRSDDPSWLERLSYDLVPLPKYFINLAYRAAGVPRPVRRDAILWYSNTKYRWGGANELVIARLPSIVMAAVGCAAIFALGTLVRDWQTGLIAAFLLAANPLYRLHAHRAMSEASCEAFLLLSLALGLWAWKKMLERGSIVGGLLMTVAAGCTAGLSILAKFNGILALLTLAGWTVLGLRDPRAAAARKLALAAGLTGAIIAAGTMFVSLNPFMTAHPEPPLTAEMQTLKELGWRNRFLFLASHRAEVSRWQQRNFSHNAIQTGAERALVVAVQGLGRFGPLGPRKSDSTRRYDLAQDWGAILWLPLVLAGLVRAIWLGKKQDSVGEAPTAWALVIWFVIAVAVVAAYLPLAWDRYQLPIQAPASLLAAILLASAWRALRASLTRPAQRP